jgi:hypothetical protein
LRPRGGIPRSAGSSENLLPSHPIPCGLDPLSRSVNRTGRPLRKGMLIGSADPVWTPVEIVSMNKPCACLFCRNVVTSAAYASKNRPNKDETWGIENEPTACASRRSGRRRAGSNRLLRHQVS